MKKITVLVSLFALLSMSLASCVSLHDPAVQILPGHIKKICVKPFENLTNQPGLELDFTEEVVNEVLMDGRLSLVDNEAEADGVLTVVIINYSLRHLVYDGDNESEQDKLWIIANASLIDKKNDVTLWTEPSLEGVEIYRNIQEGQKQRGVAMGDVMTENEARNIVWQKMARNIVRRVIKGFWTLTSMSEKKVFEE